MNPLRPQLKEIFSRATELRDHAERNAYVLKACAGNEHLQQEVQELLEQHDKGPFLSAPTSFSDKSLLHYKVLERLGEGGMGVTYKAHDTRLDRVIALKVLSPWLVTSPRAKARLRQEAQCASRLNHPNIVTIHDLACDRGIDFIVMEYVAGRSLHHVLAAGRIEVREAALLGAQITQALIAAHKEHVVHGDLKPANIMITTQDQVKLLDFSLSCIVNQNSSEAGGAKRGGTRGYVAPEQASGILDERCDIFSFGAVLYQMLSGAPAFCNDGAGQVAGMPGSFKTPPPLPRTVPVALRNVVFRCLELDPQSRYQSARELAAALGKCIAAFQDGTCIQTRRARPKKRRPQRIARRRVWRFLLPAGVIATLLAVSAFLTATRSLHTPPSTVVSPESASVGLIPEAQAGTAESVYDRAIVQMNLHKYEQAKNLFDEVLRADPSNTQALYNRAVCLQNLHRFQNAISDFTQVIKRNAKDTNALYNRAMCYMNVDQLSPALVDLTAVIRIRPSAKAYVNRAKVRAALGDAKGSSEDDRRAEQLSAAH